MESVTKFVVSRLQGAASGFESHPDADLLAAFAERSLGEEERGWVMDHVALCDDCREVLGLALPEEESVTGVVPSSAGREPSGWFGLPAFRWAVLTAAVAVATVVGVRFSHFSHSSGTAESGAIPNAIPNAIPRVIQRGVADLRSSPTIETIQANAEPAKVESSNKSAEQEVRQKQDRKMQAGLSEGSSTPGSSALVSSTTGSSTIAMNRSPMIAPDRGSDSDVDVVKAKDPVPSEAELGAPIFSPNIPLQTSPALMLRASPKWAVSASGSLQRSFDGGKNWEPIVSMRIVPMQASNGNGAAGNGSADSLSEPGSSKSGLSESGLSKPVEGRVFHAVSGIGSEVWAGGVSGMLYHSTDGGNQWTQVTPSDGAVQLTGDIISVEFLDPQHGKISTSSAEFWTTSDGAHSWQKQQ